MKKLFASACACFEKNYCHLTWIVPAFYLVYLIPSKKIIMDLGMEDRFFENLTAIAFFAAGILSFSLLLKTHNYWYLFFAFLFFFGGGEEISWGERIFHFAPPAEFVKYNVQEEFNLHNLEFINSKDLQQNEKSGILNIFTANTLFKIFWFLYGIVLPIGFNTVGWFQNLVRFFKLPHPTIYISEVFLINYIILKVLDHVLPPFQMIQYYDTATEIYEAGCSVIFLLVFIDFYYRLKKAEGKLPVN